jgi:hypothetical protein
MEPRTWSMLGRCSITELYPQWKKNQFYFIHSKYIKNKTMGLVEW